MYRPNPVPPPFVPPTPISGPLTFTAKQAGSMFAFDIEGSVSGVSLSYSIDNGKTWNPYIFGQSVNLAAVGDSVMFKGDNNSFSIDDENYIHAVMSGKIAASGSIMYLLDSQGNNKSLNDFCFNSLFSNCTSLTQAPALPATTLAAECYAYMFYGCTSLTQAPALPAITLARYCYASMFNGCTSLTQAPALPATTLVQYCYANMFYGCTSLTQAPALPATTLEQNCYANMFHDCTSLTQAPALPATTLKDFCYTNMFNGCVLLNFIQCNATDVSAINCLYNWLENVSTSGTFKKNPSMIDWPSGSSGIPNGWTIENI
jgi:hypothetical protein